jgi:hypothetical protein
MSFDVFLMSFRDGKNAPANAEAARAVLLSGEVIKESDKHYHYLKFLDGSGVEFYSNVLDLDSEFKGGMFALRVFSRQIMNFIHQFAQAAGCVIVAAMEEAYVMLPSPELAQHLHPDIKSKFKQIVVHNGAELEAILSGGYEAWLKFVNQLPGRIRP